jgi:hypothetical protein
MYQPPLARRRAAAEILRETEDGFRIAEEDLAMRGAGDLIGTAQSGLPRFRVADLERQAALMALAQTDARALLADDPGAGRPARAGGADAAVADGAGQGDPADLGAIWEQRGNWMQPEVLPMFEDLKSAIARAPATLPADMAGAAALVVLFLAALHLPGLV